MNRTLAAALLAASVATGCSQLTKPEKVAPWKTAENFCWAFLDLNATRQAACAPMTPAFESFTYRLSQTILDCGAVQQEVDAGRFRFDSAAARSCLEQASSGDCLHDPPACATALVGTVPAGAACASRLECGPETLGCVFSSACSGTCAPLGSYGTGCTGDDQCDPSRFYCDTTSMTCQNRTLPGYSCVVGGPARACAEGYYCSGSTGTCALRPGLGATCNGLAPCDDRQALSCDLIAQTCIATPTSPSPLGGRCDAPYFCDDATAYCGAGSVCAARLPLDVGAACGSADQCVLPGQCNAVPDETSSTCKAVRRLGEACWGGAYQCLTGAYCDAPSGAKGTCRALPGPGETCNDSSAYEPHYCLDGSCVASGSGSTCIPYGTAGAACGVTGAQPCGSGLTCDPGSNTCVASCF